MMNLVRCPHCESLFDPAKTPAMPFCSQRCQQLDLYRWLVTEEAPRHKREFLGTPSVSGDFWEGFETLIERASSRALQGWGEASQTLPDL